MAQATGALVATSAVATGLFNGDDYALGISGGFFSPLTAELIRNAGLIVAFGCELNMWTTRHGKLIGPEAVVAQIDVEDSALGAHRPVDRPILGSAAGVAKALLGAFADGRVSAAAPLR